MIEKGEWIIPTSYADEFAYKPPLTHWLIASFSLILNKGEVTPFTSRLPSTLAFIAMMGVCFLFFARRRSIREAFIACLVCITCFEIHRSAMTTRIDMLLTFFLVSGIIQLVNWYEKRRMGQLLCSWLMLGGAALTKGPVGIVMPCLILGVYQLIRKEPFFRAVWRCVCLGLPPLILLSWWYFAAYRIHGDDFLTKAFAENIGRFFSMSTEALGTDYNLGVENPWYYYPLSMAAGLLPWTIPLLVSLFFIRYKRVGACFDRVKAMDKAGLYGLTVIVISLLFFTIPSSKRSTYILFIYPFVALFIARFFLYLTEKRPLAIRISTTILTVAGIAVLLVVGLSFAGILDLESLSHHLSKRERTLRDIKLFADLFRYPGWPGLWAMTALLAAVCITGCLIWKKNCYRILMAGFGVVCTINICMDSFFLPAFKNGYSPRPFAEQISRAYDLENRTYVMNNLLKYKNLYGLNFYLRNNFRNFEKEQPEEGFFITLSEYAAGIKAEYGNRYEFIQLEASTVFNEYKEEMLLFRIRKKQ
ncbi:MAG: glycosyltransferase family 39 protein [Tannerellaceae bacterium]|nr:glycosyltransferase family 39 protein [Tannerellaceae bacterium]